MRIILTMLSILLASSIQTQSFKKNDSLYLYALSMDARINSGDKRLPKSIIINNGIFGEIKELQAINYSKLLDSIIKKVNKDFSRKEFQYNGLEKIKSIRTKKILPYLKNQPIIYKDSDWSLEASHIIFSNNGNEAIIAMRASSKTTVLDLTVYFFELKDERWILSKELSPFLF